MFSRIILILVVALGLTACGRKPEVIPPYNGPEITSIVVNKGERRMYMMHGNDVMRAYDIALGSAPVGHKQFEGDGKTPEGAYFINFRNPNSQYHLSLKVSYPNNADRAFADSQGRSPGGDIYIHGTPEGIDPTTDWTAGCIAVTNAQIEEIWAMVQGPIPVFIYP